MQKVTITNDIAEGKVAVISKEKAKEAPIKWGLQWITSPTPVIVTNIFRFVLYAAFLTSEILPMFPEIPEDTALHISKWALRLVAIVHLLSKTFGIDISKIIPSGSKPSTN